MFVFFYTISIYMQELKLMEHLKNFISFIIYIVLSTSKV